MVRPSLPSPRFAGRLLVVSVVLLAALAAPAAAAPKGRIEGFARLEPATLAPGQKGTLIVTGRTGDLHLYAVGTEGMTWKPVPAPGVSYGTPEGGTSFEAMPKGQGLSITEPHPYHDKDLGETYPVWEGTFELRVPVTVEASAAPGTEVGLLLDYSGCDKFNCYQRQKGHRFVARLGGEGAAAAPAPAPAPAPKVSGGCSDGAAKVSLAVKETEGGGVATVTFAPNFGWHLYLPGATGGQPIQVETVAAEDVEWGEIAIPPGDSFEEPLEVPVAFRRGPKAGRLTLRVEWQGCSSEAGGQCLQPKPCTFTIEWPAAAASDPLVDAVPTPPAGTGAATPAAAPPGSRVRFPVVGGESLGGGQTNVEKLWAEWGLLSLFVIFGIGVGLAFTPCVLPIIPITVSVIAGGRADVPKRRLVALLSAYVAGLSLAYGTLGLVASFGGASMSTAFETPVATWIIAGVFLLLSFGMLGVYELQPPAWMLRLQGGAHQRAGSLVGAFLFGSLAALLASPCTGPVIAALLVFTAKTANPVLGFAMFVTMGLGMGAVFFAAGSVNFLLKPGPWMVWVRYGFGVVLVGAALYYLANSELLRPAETFGLGALVSGLAGAGVYWHLKRREGAEWAEALRNALWVAGLMAVISVAVTLYTRPATGQPAHPWLVPAPTFAAGFLLAALAGVALTLGLRRRESAPVGTAAAAAAKVSILLVLATFGVAWFARPTGGAHLTWTVLRDVAHLEAEVAKAKTDGKAVVVDIWATWCTYCKKYEALIEREAKLMSGFDDLHRLKIDVTKDPRVDLREAIGMPPDGQPRMVFFDRQGRILRAADVEQWYGDESSDALKKRLDYVQDAAETATR